MVTFDSDSQASVARHDDLIFDIGMHQGEDTDFYLSKGFRVVAFEANPELVAECRSRFSSAISQGRLTICEGAIVPAETLAAAAGVVTFYRNKNTSAWGTVSEEFAQRNEHLGTENETIEVPYTDFNACLVKYGIPYYMKIDIEGADRVCLDALLNFRYRPRYISLESDKTSWANIRAELDLLEQLGYYEFAAVQQGTVPLQIPPNPSREGNFVPICFDLGSSGLFGKELPARWQTKAEIERTYKRILMSYRWFGDNSFLRRFRTGRLFIAVLQRLFKQRLPGWYDTHARLPLGYPTD